MSIAYRFAKEAQGQSFDYGGIEEKIDFIIDNYSDAMSIYRTIVKQIKEADIKREDAHVKLENLRADEDRWIKTKKFPKKYNAEEHQKRKDHLAELREKEYDIIHNGVSLPHDKLTHLIIHNMWVFNRLNYLDLKVRGKLGPLASKVVATALWPMTKTMEFTAKHTDSLDAEKFLKARLKDLQSVPDRLMKKIVTQ